MAAEVLVTSSRVLLGKPEAEPGLVVCVHSFGNLLNFHPHLHVRATEGPSRRMASFIVCRR